MKRLILTIAIADTAASVHLYTGSYIKKTKNGKVAGKTIFNI